MVVEAIQIATGTISRSIKLFPHQKDTDRKRKKKMLRSSSAKLSASPQRAIKLLISEYQQVLKRHISFLNWRKKEEEPKNEEKQESQVKSTSEETTTKETKSSLLSSLPLHNSSPSHSNLLNRSAMILSKPNAILNKNVLPISIPPKLGRMNLTNEEKVKELERFRKKEEQQYNRNLRNKSKIDEKKVKETFNLTKLSECFEPLTETETNYKLVTPYKGTSRDAKDIDEYLLFLEKYPSIMALNMKLDNFAHKDKHFLSEPLFLQLVNFLTKLDIQHLKSLHIHILRPNHYTFNIMMMSYLTIGDIPTVQSLYDSIEIWTESKPSYVNFVTLLSAYCRSGNFTMVNSLFKKFIDGTSRSYAPDIDDPEATTSVFTVLMKALLDIGDLQKTEELYHKFKSLGLRPSILIDNIMLKVYRLKKQYGKCEHIFNKNASRTDLHMIHSMIGVYAEMGKFSEMEKLFAQIDKPTDFTFIIMTNAYCRAGMELQAEECFFRVVNRDNKLLSTMMQMYSQKGSIDKLEQMFALIRNPNVGSIYTYVDAISRFGNFDKVNELVKTIPQDKISGKIWVCHLQSAVKTKFTDPDEYMKRVQSIFSNRPQMVSEKDNRFAMKLYKLALGKQMSAQSKTESIPLNSISEIYREFAEEKVKLAKSGVDEGKFQTRDSFHEQFALNSDSIYRPDYVSPYEAYLEGYYSKVPKKDQNDE